MVMLDSKSEGTSQGSGPADMARRESARTGLASDSVDLTGRTELSVTVTVAIALG
jgi:hypothetical protein